MRYLITGGAGFIGSHLVEKLLAEGCSVVVLDDFSSGSTTNLAAVAEHPALQIIEADVRKGPELEAAARSSDIVVHLAAAVGVQRIVEQPLNTIETNLEGVQRVLRVAESAGCRRLVFASSSEVYGKSDNSVFSEDGDACLGPSRQSRWSYASTKLTGEFLALAYHRETSLETVVCRFFNTIGPRQSERYGMVAPRLVRQALTGRPLTVYGDGLQTRCFCDVRDLSRAVFDLSECEAAGGRVFNIGAERAISIVDLATLILQLTGGSSEIVHVPYDQAYEVGFEDVRHRRPSTAALRGLTGWEPRYTLEQTLTALIESEAEALRRPQVAAAAAGD